VTDVARNDVPDEATEVLRVVLADDHAVVREGLKALVNAQPDMRVVGEAADGEAAWRAAKELAPDVLVIDLSMPVMGGAEATARVRRDCPGVKVLVLTVHEEQLYLTQLLRAGASGYVLKRAAPLELVRAVRSVASGGTYVDPALTETLVAGYLDAERAAEQPQHDVLSEREREVLLRIARGYSNKEIAAELELSVKTVETYKARVAEKLGLRTRVDIVRYAAQRGWLGDSSAPPDG
jgi:DNA-binding NarL/FixJ family response regulator